jgi:acylphosphatase
MIKSVELHIQGKVQGVFYRASTFEVAVALALCGWVKNEKDGSVKVHAQGPEAVVDQLMAWAKRGPAQARVTEVVVTEVKAEDCTAFKILYS